MLILAGAVLVLSFLLAALSVTELSSQEVALERGAEGELAATFQKWRREIAEGLSGLTIPPTTNASMFDNVIGQRVEFEGRGRDHGLFVLLDLAGVTEPPAALPTSRATLSEKKDMTDSGSTSTCPGTDEYAVWSYDGSRDYRSMDWDCTDDGILYDMANQRIAGVAIYLFISSEGARVEETFVVAVN